MGAVAWIAVLIAMAMPSVAETSAIPPSDAPSCWLSPPEGIELAALPVRAPDGTIWGLSPRGDLHRSRRLDENGWPAWERVGAAPTGFLVRQVLPLGEDSVVILGSWGRSFRTTVLFGDRQASENLDWREHSPSVVGETARLERGTDGTIWAIGEWRGVYRLDGDRWLAEVTGPPHHNTDILFAPDGTPWIRGTQKESPDVLSRREKEGWRTIPLPPLKAKGLAFVESDRALLFVDGGFHEVRAVEGTAAGSLAMTQPPEAIDACTFRDSGDGWASGLGKLFRWKAGSWTTLHVEPSRRLFGIRDLEGAGVWGIFEDGRVVRLSSCPDRVAWPPMTINEFVPGGQARVSGLTALEIDGRVHAYVIAAEGDHQLLDMDRVGAEFYEKSIVSRIARTKGLGLGVSEDSRNERVMRYPSLAIAADLDGDADQDVIGVNGYGAETLLRQTRRGRFVDWTAEGGLRREDHGLTAGTCLLDADLDGDLDLYVADMRGPDTLWVNDGRGNFRDQSRRFGISTVDGSTHPACTDIDRDGDTDILVPTWGRGFVMWESRAADEGEAAFVEHRHFVDRLDVATGEPLSTRGFNAVALAELDGDGTDEILLLSRESCDRLLTWRSGFEIGDSAIALPPNQPCRGTAGAEFLDADGDGDLDVAVTGGGGVRFYQRREDRFEWTPPAHWSEHEKRNDPKPSALALLDIDRDGREELLVGYDRSGLALGVHSFIRERERSIAILLHGPVPNTDAIGARIELIATATGKVAGVREVRAATGARSRHGRAVSFHGLDAAQRYEARIDIPGRRSLRIAPLVPGETREVHWAGTPAATRRAATLHSALTLHRDVAFLEWAVATLVACFGAASVATLSFRGRKLPLAVQGIGAACAPASALIAILAPIGPGWTLAVTSAGAALGLAVLAMIAVRGFITEGRAPELLVELMYALRAFRHNQASALALDRLRFVLENLRGPVVRSDSAHSLLLCEDLRAFREIVIPDLLALRRIRIAAGLAERREEAEIQRLKIRVQRFEKLLTAPVRSAHVKAAEHEELTASLRRVDGWLQSLHAEVAMALAIDVSDSLARYVETRRALVPCEFHLAIEGDAMRRKAAAVVTELYRALDVLVENAVRAMEGASGSRRLEIGVRAAGEGRIRIEVRDSGPGVPLSIREELFRAGVSTSAAGHGFGLHYARRAIERLGGSLDLIETGSGGSCFGIDLVAVAATSLPATERSVA